jgi:hypothetical protein
MISHILQEGHGYWEITRHPYGGEFHRASCAFGVTLLPGRKGQQADEVIVQALGESGLRTLVVKQSDLIPV